VENQEIYDTIMPEEGCKRADICMQSCAALVERSRRGAARPFCGTHLERETLTLKSRKTSGHRGGSSPDAIYLQIFDAIVHHYLAPGTKLTEDELGETFGVSRTIIHRVLLRLAHDGIVEMLPNRGAFVAQPSAKSTRDVFAVRGTLECAMAGHLADRLEPRAVQRLRTIVRTEEQARSQGDWKAQMRLSGEFHLQLAMETGNEILHDILKELMSRSSLAIAIYQKPGTSGCLPDDHAQILDALVAGNGGAATTMMKEHLLRIEHGLDLDWERSKTADLKTIFAKITVGAQEAESIRPLASTSPVQTRRKRSNILPSDPRGKAAVGE
jgi:DNA-binding GntR family transcriptional regulator